MALPSVPRFGSLFPDPLNVRRGIPLYYLKSEEENRRDVYERYDELVARQTALHLADELHGGYPLRKVSDYIRQWLPDLADAAAVDIGCSVGRQIADIAGGHPNWDCYGLDFSYQMVRQAQDYWKEGKTLNPNLLRFGYPTVALQGQVLPNLHFALADAKTLPFPDRSLDLIVNTFLIDRLPDLSATFAEWLRVLKPGGRLITISPLNFLQLDHWRQHYPPMKIIDPLLRDGWDLLDLTDPLMIHEPMDARGNEVVWKTLAFVVESPC
ncbi:SAM-dependent methyltransferase [Lewinella aquimaris]|uniref:SAM-dependent methyltransferase n=1 Tax=Neolewinella aquimaris TaxID=1835722 RepID=A0A840E0C3_9BACT|nr:class I SAM-dependent methyltransferase [Neolewinella aquimaris]MBB4078964.1 SAM-dependent methyltransferase [Neolewinella aquimaris]